MAVLVNEPGFPLHSERDVLTIYGKEALPSAFVYLGGRQDNAIVSVAVLAVCWLGHSFMYSTDYSSLLHLLPRMFPSCSP